MCPNGSEGRGVECPEKAGVFFRSALFVGGDVLIDAACLSSLRIRGKSLFFGGN